MKFHRNLVIGLVLLLWGGGVLAQDCSSSIIPSAPNSRYQNNGDGTITDLSTGLMWQQCSLGGNCDGSARSYKWNEALQAPEIMNANGGFAGYSDWRLPNIKELASLLEVACWIPVINTNVFPKTMSWRYWSSSPSLNENSSWSVNFSIGHVNIVDRRANIGYGGYHVRLVRDR